MERRDVITSRNNPLTLIGNETKVGDNAPNFSVVDNDMKVITLPDLQGKIKIFSVVPSLDTRVCDLQTQRFNDEAQNLDESIKIYTFSMDLPFAQKRWSKSIGIENVKLFSDYRERSFGQNYGLLINETKLLARAVLILDENNIIRYLQIVKDISTEPDYADVFNSLTELKNNI